jgi:eukaryotic-like serine/threonine-protein kinase
MQIDRFKQLQAIFDAALEESVDARTDFVNRACNGDRALAEEVMDLLRYESLGSASKTVQPFALVAEAFNASQVKSLIGQTIGRFRLEAEIGSGGMGRVFKASRVDGSVDQTVALKLIRRELFDSALLKRFSFERQILASLNHPGIAHLIDAGTDEHGSPFVAMEYVDGLPLLDYSASKALSIRDRVALFRQILAAVSFAHRNLVVHRDLKPENVLVTSEGQVKLLDFGIAKALQTGHQQTATADQFFTPAYAAPEQLLGQNIAVTCDVYALGAILYTLLTGVPPFDLSMSSAGEVERHILKIPPAPLHATALKRGESVLRAQGVDNVARWARHLEGDLENIVQKALRKEPKLRYASVEQFDDDLERFLSQRPVLASGTGWIYRTRKFCERNAAAVLFTAMASIASLVGIGQFLHKNEQIRLERDHAKMALSVLQNSFRSADPTQLAAGDTRARAILTAAAHEVGLLQKKQPLLFQDLAHQIGEIQLNLGMTNAGLGLIQRANRMAPSPSNAGILLEIRGLIMDAQLGNARALIEKNRSRLKNDPEFSAEDAHALYLDKHYPEAIGIYKRLLLDRKIVNSPALQDRIYLYLAEAYRQSDKFADAAHVLDKQIVDQQRRYGRDHPLTMMSRLRRIELLIDTGDTASAEREILAIKPLLDIHYDQGSALQGEYHNIRGKFLLGQNRRDEALEQFRQALSINQFAIGPDHENTLRSHLNVAMMIAYTRQDRSEAYPHFSRAISGIEKSKGLSSSMAGFSRLQAAKSHFWDKDTASALRVLTPPNALQYFPEMPEANQKEYLAALYYGFGPQNCKPGWERTARIGPEPDRIAHTLMCRYDPDGKVRPTE